jgi:hypothetical protein
MAQLIDVQAGVDMHATLWIPTTMLGLVLPQVGEDIVFIESRAKM